MSDALTLLSEMATNSPRSQALASLHMTPEELARHTQEMREFLSKTTFPSLEDPSTTSTSASTAESTIETAAETASQSTVATSAMQSNSSNASPHTPSSRTRRRAGISTQTTPSLAGSSRVLRSRVTPNKVASPPKMTSGVLEQVDDTSDGETRPAKSSPHTRKRSLRVSTSQASSDASIPTSSFYGDTSQPKPKGTLKPSQLTSSSGPRPRVSPYTVVQGPISSSNGPKKIRLVYTSTSSASSAPTASTLSPAAPIAGSSASHSTSITSTPSSLTTIPISTREPDDTSASREADAESDEDGESPFTLPLGPRSTEKPPWSYAALIGQAILASKQQKLSLNQIYQYISMAYPYYKKDAPGWRNSIRHNLSLNGSFYKTERSTFKRGKGSLWAIKEEDLECFADGNYIRKGSVAHNRKRKLQEAADLRFSQAESSKKPKLSPPTATSHVSPQTFYTAAGYPAVLQPGAVVAAATGPTDLKFPQLFYYAVPPGPLLHGVVSQLYTYAPLQVPVPGNPHMITTAPMPGSIVTNSPPSGPNSSKDNRSSPAASSSATTSTSTADPALPPATLPLVPKTGSTKASKSVLPKAPSATTTITPTPPGFPPASLNLKHLSTFLPHTPTKTTPTKPTIESTPGHLPSSSPIHVPPTIARQKKTPPAVDKGRFRSSRSKNRPLGFRIGGGESPVPSSSPSSPMVPSSSTLPASPLLDSSPLPPSSLPSSPALPSSPLPSSSPISSPSTFLQELEPEGEYDSDEDDAVSAKALLAQFQAVSEQIERCRSGSSACTSASSMYGGDDIELPNDFMSDGAQSSDDEGFGVDIVNEDLALPKELELGLCGDSGAGTVDRQGSSDSEGQQTLGGLAQPPPLTPNASSSSPPIQTPENQKLALASTASGIQLSEGRNRGTQSHGSLLIMEAETHRNAIDENTAPPRLQPSFELNAKKPCMDDDSPESGPRMRPAPPDSPPLSPTTNIKAGRLSSVRSATEMIYRALEYKANKSIPSPAAPSKPKTPMGWKSNSSHDLVLNSHKAPMTPFVRPTTPPPRKVPGGSTDNSHRQHTFLTPPPKVRGGKPIHDGESSEERAQRNSNSHSTPKISPGERSLRDMFGFSPARTPLMHRSHLSPQSASFSNFKRSLLPPSPFRTPTSSARLTGRKGHDDGDGADDDGPDPYDPSSDVAEEFARLSDAPSTPMGSSTLFQRTNFFRSPGMPSPGGWRMF